MVWRLDPIGRFRHIEWTERTASTNADLRAQAAAGVIEPRVLLTDEQTAGRGRRGRTWDMAPGGGLLLSFLVPWSDERTAHLVPTALGIAAVDAIADHGRTVGLKWPNDVVASDDRKVAGMLSEIVRGDDGIVGVIVGFGCNVSWPAHDLPGLPEAVSLDRLGNGRHVDRRALAEHLVERFDAELDRAESLGERVVHDRYRDRSSTIGRRVRVTTDDGEVIGLAVDIDADGRLLVDDGTTRHTLAVGDVQRLRPGESPPG